MQLLWDEYSYSYGTNAVYGNKRGDVILKSEMKGDRLPFLLPESPPTASKTGIDLHINRLSDPEDLLWLESLIWPEHKERRELFESAAAAFLLRGTGLSFWKGWLKICRKNQLFVFFIRMLLIRCRME
ncbi:DUF2332 family protein [Metabacillus sp. RGM 3146]|uniref:DUF2332 family protein n=1 Tax=Metabacillus sp. RGM 3146 TaxID=3401092 RepID=UPI003B99D648